MGDSQLEREADSDDRFNLQGADNEQASPPARYSSVINDDIGSLNKHSDTDPPEVNVEGGQEQVVPDENLPMISNDS